VLGQRDFRLLWLGETTSGLGASITTVALPLVLQAVTSPFALLMPLAAPGAGLLLFAVGAFMVGTGVAVCNVVVGSFRQRYCPPELLGRVVATTMMLNHSTIPLGSLLGGLLGGTLGLRPTMWIMTGVVASCWLILALGPMRRRRDLPHAYEAKPVPDSAALAGDAAG